jgi:hypothetical protein
MDSIRRLTSKDRQLNTYNEYQVWLNKLSEAAVPVGPAF